MLTRSRSPEFADNQRFSSSRRIVSRLYTSTDQLQSLPVTVARPPREQGTTDKSLVPDNDPLHCHLQQTISNFPNRAQPFSLSIQIDWRESDSNTCRLAHVQLKKEL